MALPSVTREQVLAAFSRFDRDFSQQPEFANWQDNKSYKYAIPYNNKLYPMKPIIEIATGVSKDSFSGGPESIAFIKKYGLTAEPLRLPNEREVSAALHDLLLTKHPEPVQPIEAYAELAESFALSKSLRTATMDGSDKNHWENRVQWARKLLVDQGVIDNSEHGIWKLTTRPTPRWWVEKTIVAGRKDREEGEHALGKALWSPTRSRIGNDIYRNMRLVEPGDRVLHLIDNQRITGVSVADSRAKTDFVGLPQTEWADLDNYRIQLRDYQQLAPPIERDEFFGPPAIRAELLTILVNHDGLFYTKDLDLNQGAYFTEAPLELVEVFDRIYQAKTGGSLPGFQANEAKPSAEIISARLVAAIRLFHWKYGEEGFESGWYQSEERDYKYALSVDWRKLATREAFENVLTGKTRFEEFADKITKPLYDPSRSNLLPWRYADVLKGPWEKERAEVFVRATYKLLFDSDRGAPAVDEFNAALAPYYASTLNATAVKPASHCIPSLMLWLSDPERQFFVRPDLYSRTVNCLLGVGPLGQGNIMTTAYYMAALEFARALTKGLVNQGLSPKDMIDVQGFAWGVFSQSKVWFGGKFYSGDTDMLPKFLERQAYAVGFARRPEIADLFRDIDGLNREGWEQRRQTLRGLLPDAAEQRAVTALFDLVGSPGSLLLTKSTFFNRGLSKSILRISAAGITRAGYQLDNEIGHRIPVDWRSEIKFDAELTGSLFPKLNGTLVALPMAEALDAIAVPVIAGEEAKADTDVLPPVPPATTQPIYTTDDFVQETRQSKKMVESWLARAKRKRQLIFQGPPGTGKTFIAERLAKLIVSGTNGITDIVQFHPSYSYEDFLQGIKPQVKSGSLTYDIAPGRFLEFCERAKTSNAPSVLIIDEINRANLSRVFGELMYLLEYRNKKVPLAAGGESFEIPRNIYLVGTMNTADRSIALVDHALRRRFSFIYLEPDYEVLRSYLTDHSLPVDGLIKTLKAINSAIDDRHYSVGISFFLSDGKHLRSTLEDIWRGEIEPYLEEYFYDQEEKAKAFRWETVITGDLKDWS